MRPCCEALELAENPPLCRKQGESDHSPEILDFPGFEMTPDFPGFEMTPDFPGFEMTPAPLPDWRCANYQSLTA